MNHTNSRWEHRTVFVLITNTTETTTDAINEAMHNCEALGWELVSAVYSQIGFRLFFKRQVLDDSTD